MNFKPSEFLQALRKIERLLRDAVAELRAIRELLEKGAELEVMSGPQYYIVCDEAHPDWPTDRYIQDEDSTDASWKWRTKVEESDES